MHFVAGFLRFDFLYTGYDIFIYQDIRKVIVMDKLLRNISEELWRQIKAQAALEGLSQKDWVEQVLAEKLQRKDLLVKRRDRRLKT